MKHALLGATLLLCACRDERPQAPTEEQSQQLNEAEDLLDVLANEKGPEDASSDPSSNE